VRARGAQLGVVVGPGGDADGQRVRDASRFHVAWSVADVGERAALPQGLGLARSVAPPEDLVDHEADVVQAPVCIGLVFRRHDHGVRAGRPHGGERVGRARQRIGAGDPDGDIEIAEPIGQLDGAPAGEAIGELEVEVAAKQRVEEVRVGKRARDSCAKASMVAWIPGRESTSVMSRSKPTTRRSGTGER